MKPLLIVDGDNLAHRAYHTTPKSVRGTGDRPINAIVGFFSILLKLWQEELPRNAFIAWDTLGVDTYRNELWPPYQGGRIFEPEIKVQLNELPEICRAFAFGVGKQPGYEADDLAATIALEEQAQGGRCLIYTTDKDSYQLVSEHITVVSPKRGSPTPERIDPQKVVDLLGVLPQQVPDYKALSGDSSDKIPGIKGIGPKAACSLLLKFGTLDRIIETWTNESDIQLASKFRDVVTMRTDADVVAPTSGPNWASGAAKLQEIGATGVSERILKLVEQGLLSD